MVSLSNHEGDLGRRPGACGLAPYVSRPNLTNQSDRAHAERAKPPVKERLMRLPISIVCTGLFALALMAGQGSLIAPARAQDAFEASMANYAKIPAGATFVTDMNENTELTSNAESVLRQSLAKRGLTYDVDGKIGFKIGTYRTVGARTPDAVFDPSNTILHLNLNSGDVKGTPRLGHSFRIALTAYDRASGSVLAQGDVTDDQPDADSIAVTGPMIEKLLDRMEF